MQLRQMSLSIAREPLLHLIVMGAIIYGLYHWTNIQAVDQSFASDISTEVTRKLQDHESQNGAPLTLEQKKAILLEATNEEVLFLEAKRLKLDHDSFIRERLIQKARFYIEGQFVPPEPDEKALQDFYLSHRENYRKRQSVSFEQRLLNADGVSSIKNILALSPSEPEFIQRLIPLQKQSLVSSRFENATIDDVKEIFGDEFLEEMLALPLHQWQGFIESSQGFHVVKVNAIEKGRFSDFSEIKETIKKDWIESHKRQWLQQQLDALRTTYNLQVDESKSS